jgi:hypothetical protein
VAAAREQGLAGLLHEAMVAGGAPWPEPVVSSLQATRHAALFSGVQQLEVAGRTQRRLHERGIRSLPLKAAALAELLYESVADRPMADVDLLVLDDWPGAVSVLEEGGLLERERGDHVRSFLDPASGVILELHHSLTSCPGLYTLDPEGLWARSRPASGQLDRLPSAEDLLVHLSLHAAFQHAFALRLVQLLDFRRLLERERLDPVLLGEIASRAGADVALAASLKVAALVVAAPIAPAILEDLGTRSPARLPRRLEAWIDSRRPDPTTLIAPRRPPLGWVRWQLARGRRLALVEGTLAPAEPGVRRAAWRRGLGALRRLGALWLRWGLHRA